MALKVGDTAPDFLLPSTKGVDFRLSEKKNAFILYFYPKDFTPGCTAEACDFRDNISYFKEFDIDVVGVSKDSIKTHHEFIKKHSLPFELLADEQGEVSKLYKAKMPLLGMTKRITYMIDENKKIVAVYSNLINAKKHIKQMIANIKATKDQS